MERYRVCGGGPAHMAVEETSNKGQKEKSKLSLSPQLSCLSSLRAFKDILVFFWYFLSHQSTSCNFSGDGKSWWIRVRRVRKCHSDLRWLQLRGEVPWSNLDEGAVWRFCDPCRRYSTYITSTHNKCKQRYRKRKNTENLATKAAFPIREMVVLRVQEYLLTS